MTPYQSYWRVLRKTSNAKLYLSKVLFKGGLWPNLTLNNRANSGSANLQFLEWFLEAKSDNLEEKTVLVPVANYRNLLMTEVQGGEFFLLLTHLYCIEVWGYAQLSDSSLRLSSVAMHLLFNLLFKYSHFWLQKPKMVTAIMPNSRLQSSSNQMGKFGRLLFICFLWFEY